MTSFYATGRLEFRKGRVAGRTGSIQALLENKKSHLIWSGLAPALAVGASIRERWVR
jgi:hypothetical protein